MTIYIPNYRGEVFPLKMYEQVTEPAPYGDIIYLLTKKAAPDGGEERPMLVVNCPDGTIFPDHFIAFDLENPGYELSNKMTGHNGGDFADNRHTILYYIIKTI